MTSKKELQKEIDRLERELEQKDARIRCALAVVDAFETATKYDAMRHMPRPSRRPDKDWVEKLGDIIWGPMR